MNFEALDLLGNGFARRQQHRHGDHRAHIARERPRAAPGPAASLRPLRASPRDSPAPRRHRQPESRRAAPARSNTGCECRARAMPPSESAAPARWRRRLRRCSPPPRRSCGCGSASSRSRDGSPPSLRKRGGRRRSGDSPDRARVRTWRVPATDSASSHDLELGIFELRASSSMALRYRLRVAKSICAKSLPSRSTSSTRLTLSNNSAQSTSDISRMLVMMLRTVTFDAPCR